MPTIVLTPNLTGCDGISHLSRLIVRAYGDVAVIALHEPPSLEQFERAQVVGAGSRNARFAAAALQHAASIAADTTVIVVHLHLAPAALAFAARGARVVTCLCGIEAWTPLNWAQRALLLRSRPVFAISEHTARRFRAANPRLAQVAVPVCHPGIPAAESAGAIPASAPVALIVGRMSSEERYKGHDTLIDVWRDVTARIPGARLEIVGDGDDRPRLEAKAASQGPADSIVFLGRVDDDRLRSCYQRCNVLVMPSRDEGFGLVYLEAMRAGRACIAAPGAASEIVDHGRTGLIIDPQNGAELSAGLVSLLGSRSLAAAMGAAGRARFLTHFTDEHFRSRLNRLVPPDGAAVAIPA